LRTHLKGAGVTRAELHASSEDKSRKAITFYDCRSTGITWHAVRGDDPLKIMADTGHTNFQTTQGYIREVVVIRDGFGLVFSDPSRHVTQGESVLARCEGSSPSFGTKFRNVTC